MLLTILNKYIVFHNFFLTSPRFGEVLEWLKRYAWKAYIRCGIVSRVRISSSPQIFESQRIKKQIK